MNRREWLHNSALAGGLGALPAALPANAAPLKITDIRTILTAPADLRLVVVKVMTNEQGLYGLGCATFTQRARAVADAVDTYLKPFLIGKDPTQIEDIWQSSYVSGYWRNGPVLSNALSGVDMALWDILGKRTGLPLYQLFGGKCRKAAEAYRHANGSTFQEVEEATRKFMAQGFRVIRVQVDVPGLAAYGGRGTVGKQDDRTAGANAKPLLWEPKPYVRLIPKLFEYLRKQLGDEVELLHDVHERVPPILAIQLAKDLEPFKLFFLEDPLSPEDGGYFSKIRQQTSTPLAMGELFNNVNEYLPLITDRLIDFIRIHITQVGGLSMARKVAAMCEFFGVRTAWHGPGISPVGHAANIHLDLAIPNFGIQEAREFTQAERDVFPGCPTLKDGYFWVTDQPGLGIDIDENVAAKFPVTDNPSFDYRWGNFRRRDGSVVKP